MFTLYLWPRQKKRYSKTKHIINIRSIGCDSDLALRQLNYVHLFGQKCRTFFRFLAWFPSFHHCDETCVKCGGGLRDVAAANDCYHLWWMSKQKKIVTRERVERTMKVHRTCLQFARIVPWPADWMMGKRCVRRVRLYFQIMINLRSNNIYCHVDFPCSDAFSGTCSSHHRQKDTNDRLGDWIGRTRKWKRTKKGCARACQPFEPKPEPYGTYAHTFPCVETLYSHRLARWRTSTSCACCFALHVHGNAGTHGKWYGPAPRECHFITSIGVSASGSLHLGRETAATKQQPKIIISRKRWMPGVEGLAHGTERRAPWARRKDDVGIHNWARLKSICEIWYCSGLILSLTDDDDEAAVTAAGAMDALFILLSSYFALIQSRQRYRRQWHFNRHSNPLKMQRRQQRLFMNNNNNKKMLVIFKRNSKLHRLMFSIHQKQRQRKKK